MKTYWRQCITKFQNSLSSVNWKDILDGENADDDNRFINKFSEVYDEWKPQKKESKLAEGNSNITPDYYKGLLKSILSVYLAFPSDEQFVKLSGGWWI